MQNNVPQQNIFVLDKGDVFELTGSKAAKTGRVPAGALLVDQTGAVVPGLVIKDRLLMGEDGMVVTVLTIDRKSGQLLTSPDIITRGFIAIKDNEELMNELRTELKRFSLRRFSKVDINRFKQELRDHINNFLYKSTQRTPIIIPVVNAVGNGAKLASQPQSPQQSPQPAAS
jgi:ribonuclease J